MNYGETDFIMKLNVCGIVPILKVIIAKPNFGNSRFKYFI